MKPPLAKLLTQVDHVGIAVPEIDPAIRWYTKTWGLRLERLETNEDQGVVEAMLTVGEGTTRIQLLAPITPDSPLAKFLDTHGTGIHQVAYSVEDLDQVSAELRERGVELLYDQARPGTNGCRVNFCHPRSAGGILVELVERPASQ